MKFSVHFLPALFILTASSGVFASSAVALKTTVDVSYTLQDLNLRDSIAPKLSFPNQRARLAVGDAAGAQYTGNPWESYMVSHIPTSGTTAISDEADAARLVRRGGFTETSVSFSDAQLSAAIQSVNSAGPGGVEYGRARISRAAVYEYEGGLASFTLSPYTSVTFSLNISQELSLDQSLIKTLAGGTAGITVDLISNLGGPYLYMTSHVFSASGTVQSETPRYAFDLANTTFTSLFSFQNNSDYEQAFQFPLIQTSSIVLNITPVPEPSTYGLMLLGLGGIAVAARQRRRQQAS
ncbi:PEP-CTERM sorting domain-containing protein [Aquabacterium fontiphilum]|jgi:hypothetical protein|uniref:PEP-CTERM sorting domain-containing protein n=1 Tax=Aquabacterium fontiphilum TaxID=450365 RepID=UPI0013765CB4|nr:PEP-CTERM sorting domain-containing protein [Aquabacterium fontiphilum]NBD19113.1 PEP-CTERM sorting domain-containing protein [Aquabacterium fontiphilum]